MLKIKVGFILGGEIVLQFMYVLTMLLSPDIRMFSARKIIWTGHIARMGEEIHAYEVLVRKPEGKRILGSPSHILEDNIKIYVK
jgi:hypothetical protein